MIDYCFAKQTHYSLPKFLPQKKTACTLSEVAIEMPYLSASDVNAKTKLSKLTHNLIASGMSHMFTATQHDVWYVFSMLRFPGYSVLVFVHKHAKKPVDYKLD